ncbi:hypothetical protein [Saccharomonospora cyanea]|uniref:hypothetical protein n=1 Tax=Saccharomonospora cyanea TaxID=40989 RepID=UPI0003182E9E|nr:hypothetical protein [Saccharomonospora cyanea]
MANRADPKLIEQLRHNQAAVRARSAAIAEYGKQVTQKLAANTLEHLQSMRKHAAEAQKRKAEHEKQQGEEDDPTAKNQWLQRREGRDETFQFGQEGAGEAADSPAAARSTEERTVAPPVSPPVPVPRRQQPPASGPARRETRPADDFDDDDFSNNSWLQ